MRKILFIITICVLGLSAYAQDTTKAKQHNNEFGIDITGFFKQYLNIGNSSQFPESYTPTYYLTYRRHFSCGNLRVQVGGDYVNDQVPGDNSQDTNIGYTRGYSLNASLGWEFFNNLSKKWQVFYGADMQTSLVYSNSNATNEAGQGYLYGRISKTEIIGFAPLLGIRFKLTKRLSILTEASYSVNCEKVFNGTFYVLTPGSTATLPPTSSQRYTMTYTTFSQPLDVFIDFTI
jgi:hypothetical protein